jgi:hypothetical protein
VLYSKFGKLLAAKFDEDFTYSVLNDDFQLEIGEYVCLIDPQWDTTNDNDPHYRTI